MLRKTRQLTTCGKKSLMELWKSVEIQNDHGLKERKVTSGHKIMIEGEPCKSVFIVRSGNF